MTGWIKLRKDIADSWLWSDAEKLKWYLDLVFLAAPKDDEGVVKGQVNLTMHSLAKRWKTNVMSVSRFLHLLDENGYILLFDNPYMLQKVLQKVLQIIVLEHNELKENVLQKVLQKMLHANKEKAPIPPKENNNINLTCKEDKEPPYNPPKGYEIFDFDFLDREFAQVFFMWLDYKYDTFKDRYKTQQSIQACYNNLLKLSHNDPKTAFDVVNQSMANNWKGLFELKTSNNGNFKTTSEQREAAEYDKAARIIARLGSENSGGYGDLWEHQ